MSRELKANLIFLICLIVLASPGFAILMYRRLNGPTKPMFMGDPVRVSIAYNHPPPVPPGLPRVEPPLVRAWVLSILQDEVGQLAAMLRTSADPAAGPVMSDRFVAQALQVHRDNQDVTFCLLLWSAAATSAENVRIFSEPYGDAKLDSLKPRDVPKEIRHALQEAGFIDPPDKVSLVTGRFMLGTSAVFDSRIFIQLPAQRPEALVFPDATQ